MGVPRVGTLHPYYREGSRGNGHSCQEVGRLGGGGADKLVLAIASVSQRHVMHGYQLKWEIKRLQAGGLGKDEKA